jgi:RND family efflux transporter MFP subunit
MVKIVGRLIGLIVVTIFAIAVAIAATWGTGEDSNNNVEQDAAAETAASVAVQRLEPEQLEITLLSSGMIEPWERHTISAEISGRIVELGKNEQDQTLHEGDRVTAGQLMVRLDQRVLQARRKETAARLEQAEDELRRIRDLRRRSSNAISDAEYQKRVTDAAVAGTMATVAETNLEDATISAPASGIISRRMINNGESVRDSDPLFEIVEVDDVLLMVGVPEFQVYELINRRKQVRANLQNALQARKIDPNKKFARADLLFLAHVDLLGKDRYGRPWPALVGRVHRFSETADDKTGLCEVEILLSNKEGRLRPGQIALANIVIDRITGFRLPLSAAIYREDNAYLFAVVADPKDKKQLRAKRLNLEEYVEQGSDLIIPEAQVPADYRTVVVRGQHRIVSGRLVTIVPNQSSGSGSDPVTTTKTASPEAKR